VDYVVARRARQPARHRRSWLTRVARADIISGHPGLRLDVEGHTDDVGGDARPLNNGVPDSRERRMGTFSRTTLAVLGNHDKTETGEPAGTPEMAGVSTLPAQRPFNNREREFEPECLAPRGVFELWFTTPRSDPRSKCDCHAFKQSELPS
jgi:hypothetical protein